MCNFNAQKMQRIAIIDLGTNTFKLLIADVEDSGTYKVILRNKIPVKLGDGGVEENIITTQAFQRGINALNTFKYNIIDYFGAKRVFAFATSAIRSSSNGQWFVDYVKQHIDISIETISGDTEAEMIYEGVKQAIPFETENYLVCDIGGGSTEFIIGNKNEMVWKQSFRVGASRLAERFRAIGPISGAEIKEMEVYFEKKLTPLFAALQKYPVKHIIGSSGAFSTLARMASLQNQKNDTAKEKVSTEISQVAFENIRDKIFASTEEERKFFPGIKLIRVKMMLPAAVFINFILKKIKFDKLYFSDYALKEGVISWVIDRLKEEQN